jgi:hypothetical protein
VLRTRRAQSGFLVLSLLLLITPATLRAQGSSAWIGSVHDAATGEPVPNALVTATSPSLQRAQSIWTDSSGEYRIAGLPPGQYTLRVEKKGFRLFSRSELTLQLDRTIRVNLDLIPDVQLGEEIVVTGRAPTVDVGSTQTGVNVSPELIHRLPLVPPGSKGSSIRSFESLAEMAPGANFDFYGVSLNGATSPENQFVIDGLVVNDPGFGILGVPLSVEFIQELNVITGGYMPEYGRAMGGVLNVLTKSGSNEFHGSFFSTLTPGVLEASRPRVFAEGQTITSHQSLWNFGDFGAELGGPILRDRLWFYAGVAPSFARYQIERHLNVVQFDRDNHPIQDNGFTVTRPIDGTQEFRFADSKTVQYIGKLSYLLSPGHRLSLSVFGTPTVSGGDGAYGSNPRNGLPQVTAANGATSVLGSYDALANHFISNSRDAVALWSSSFADSRLLLDVSLGWHHQRDARLPADGSEISSPFGLAGTPTFIFRRSSPGPHSILDFESLPDPTACDPAGTPQATLCPVTRYVAGGPGFINDASMDRYQGRVVGSYQLRAEGHHLIKAGLELEQARYQQTKAWTGTVAYRELSNGQAFSDFREYGYLKKPDFPSIDPKLTSQSHSNTIGGFVQDSWSVLDLFTLNLGMRYDAQWLVGDDQRTAFKLLNQWSPRIGILYDFTKVGRSKLYLSYARYFESVPLDIIDRAFPVERRVSSIRLCVPSYANGFDPVAVTEACATAQRAPIGDSSDPNRLWTARGGGAEVVDGQLKAQSSDEILLGGEYEVVPEGRLGAYYTRRRVNHIIEDMSRDEGTTFFIGNPGEGIATDFPKAVRDYDAVTLYFTKLFSRSWLAQASYTWSSLRGNYGGLFRPETGQLDPNITSDFDLTSLVVNRRGPLPGDRTHSIKVFGAKELSLGASNTLTLGFAYRARSGDPLSVLGSHPIYGLDEAFILPRGAGGRLPWVHTCDAHLAVSYHLSRQSILVLGFDVFNLFNFAAVTARDQRYTSQDVLPIPNGTQADLDNVLKVDGTPLSRSERNPNYGNVQANQDPRRFRLSARISF